MLSTSINEPPRSDFLYSAVYLSRQPYGLNFCPLRPNSVARYVLLLILVDSDTKSEGAALPRFNQMSTLADGSAIPFSDEDNATRIGWQKPKFGVKGTDVEEKPGISQALPQIDEASDLYLIGIIASLNIAVFLFEIASPIRSPGMGPFSIPMLYGAKINGLILSGEWWRLVTPMFLHSGVLHIALGCWALLVFGPKVSRSYGPFTFLLIYFLGGISGNLISFLHTPELTVGGTGPIFAMIGAWLIYQIQNKGVIPKNVSHSLFQKAIITTALSFLLSNLGPIDDWSHFGAAATGIIYGYFTCPSLQMDNDLPSKGGQKEGITLIPRYADPCKSTLLFFLFILALGCLAFLMEPPLTNLMADDFV
ncbi:hypothetical protein SAY87_000119 [Trapa incisa]|uniref:Peptidase S54 rhomboid domain-containing protein n=1 Tax=Trapa incisa TaxID=236973 RepID=A0AAN7JGX7_9MYRT|nr:hypothetical protein SAY87_000119 [Trapa incisa]